MKFGDGLLIIGLTTLLSSKQFCISGPFDAKKHPRLPVSKCFLPRSKTQSASRGKQNQINMKTIKRHIYTNTFLSNKSDKCFRVWYPLARKSFDSNIKKTRDKGRRNDNKNNIVIRFPPCCRLGDARVKSWVRSNTKCKTCCNML